MSLRGAQRRGNLQPSMPVKDRHAALAMTSSKVIANPSCVIASEVKQSLLEIATAFGLAMTGRKVIANPSCVIASEAKQSWDRHASLAMTGTMIAMTGTMARDDGYYDRDDRWVGLVMTGKLCSYQTSFTFLK